jgi:hypothetical protein
MGNSDFLVKEPSFIDGAARSIDLFGDFDDYCTSSTPEEADARALFHDIAALREDASIALAATKQKATRSSGTQSKSGS